MTSHPVNTAAPVMDCVTSQREDTGVHAHKVLAETSVKSDYLGLVKMSWCWRMPQALEPTISWMKTTSHSQCTATLEPFDFGAAWTIIQSCSLRNFLDHFQRRPFYAYNMPMNPNSPGWQRYRLSLPRMQSIRNASTHWRAT